MNKKLIYIADGQLTHD